MTNAPWPSGSSVQSASSLSTKLDVEAPFMTVDGKRAGCRRLVAAAAAADERPHDHGEADREDRQGDPSLRAITMTTRQTRLASL